MQELANGVGTIGVSCRVSNIIVTTALRGFARTEYEFLWEKRENRARRERRKERRREPKEGRIAAIELRVTSAAILLI